MKATGVLLLLGILPLAFADSNPTIKLIHKNYEVANKYVCVNKMNLFVDRPILFNYGQTFINGFPGVTKFYCDMAVVSRSKHTGILATVQHYHFRMSNPTTCYDWLRYNRDLTLRCGESRYGMHLSPGGKFPPSPRVSMYSGPFLTGTSWAESANLVSKGNIVQPEKTLNTHINVEAGVSHAGVELKLVIAYTGFRECDADNVPKGWFNCGYGVCILSSLLYDGVVNCPFGDCIDEGSCEDALKNFNSVIGALKKQVSPNSHKRKPPSKESHPDKSNNNNSNNQNSNGQCSEKALTGVQKSCSDSANNLKEFKKEFQKQSGIVKKVSERLELTIAKIEKSGSGSGCGKRNKP